MQLTNRLFDKDLLPHKFTWSGKSPSGPRTAFNQFERVIKLIHGVLINFVPSAALNDVKNLLKNKVLKHSVARSKCNFARESTGHHFKAKNKSNASNAVGAAGGKGAKKSDGSAERSADGNGGNTDKIDGNGDNDERDADGNNDNGGNEERDADENTDKGINDAGNDNADESNDNGGSDAEGSVDDETDGNASGRSSSDSNADDSNASSADESADENAAESPYENPTIAPGGYVKLKSPIRVAESSEEEEVPLMNRKKPKQ